MTTYYQKNRTKILAYKKRYKEEHVDAIHASQHLHYLNNKEKIRQKCKKYYSLHKDEIIALEIKNKRSKREKDPFVKMKHNVRSLISMVLRSRNFTKNSKTAILLGCSFDTFNAHIESQFDLIMNWNNYNTVWTYDHICPCAQAKNEEELIKLQHYTNIRPYKDNIQKSDNKTLEGEEKCRQLLNREWM